MGRTGLSRKELSRVEVIERVKAGSLGLRAAAELLELSYRQGKAIWARCRAAETPALQHVLLRSGFEPGLCGAVSRGRAATGRKPAMRILGRRWRASTWLADDGLAVQAETLRRWMKQAGLWRRQRRRKPYRQRRERKPHFGELVQLDGSFHEWLEERGERACLMHMVDDATSTVLGRFSQEETTWAAARVLRSWIERYGVPRALYTDWKNVYVQPPNAQEAARRTSGDAVWTHVRAVGHPHHRSQFAAGQRRWSGRTVPIRTGW